MNQTPTFAMFLDLSIDRSTLSSMAIEAEEGSICLSILRYGLSNEVSIYRYRQPFVALRAVSRENSSDPFSDTFGN